MKTQNFPLAARPSTTLTTSSMLFAEKNQKAPASPVRATAWPSPPSPSAGAVQETVTRNRALLRQRVVAFGEQKDCTATRPILSPLNSVNQMFPSGPEAISVGVMGVPPEVGMGSSVTEPAGVMRPIRSRPDSANQRLPS